MNARNASGKSGSCDSVPSVGLLVGPFLGHAPLPPLRRWSDRTASGPVPPARGTIGWRARGGLATAGARPRGKMTAMCGLLAFFSAHGDAAAHRDNIAGALECLHHRGPDETGVEVIGDASGRYADGVFAHKRLAIIDVASSHEPLPYAGRPLPADLQRRDLQLHRAARGADPRLRRPVRHRRATAR